MPNDTTEIETEAGAPLASANETTSTGESSNKSNGVAALPAIIKLAEVYDLDAAAFVYTFRSIAMPLPHTEPEFVSCCLVARKHGLNPLTKEIYFMRDKHGKIQAIVGVDGWIKKCNEHPQFDGIEFDDNLGNDGKAISIKATIFRKDRTRPISVTEYMAECLQTRDKAGPWQSHPNRMLRHRSLIQCARVAFGFAGIMDRDEFDQWMLRDVTPGATTPSVTPSPHGKPALPDLPSTSMAALPSTDATPIAIDQSALLRTIERRIEAEPAKHREIEEEFRPQIMAMDDDGKSAVALALHAARSGDLNVRAAT